MCLGIVVTIDPNEKFFASIWENVRYAEYRAPYDSHLRHEVFCKVEKPTTFDEIESWIREEINGSWSIRMDLGIHSDNTTEWLKHFFIIHFTREEDATHFKFRWCID